MNMRIGIPTECMTGEFRVALAPGDCEWLTQQACEIHVESGAGEGSGFSDTDYIHAGCNICHDKASLYESVELIVKVKQPLAADLEQLQSHHTVFSYMHLAAEPALIQRLCDIGLTAIPFESITDSKGRLPLLAPMSAIAGRVATMRGASLLFRNTGGRGVLLGGPQIQPNDEIKGNVVVIGAGVAGSHAAITAAALGAKVHILDLNEDRLTSLKQQHPDIHTELSTADSIDRLCSQADLVIGAVLLSGRRAPVLLTHRSLVKMNPGSVIIDIAIDQGGCVEGIRACDANHPVYEDRGLLYSAVPNMPSSVARTASQALSTAIHQYVLQIATGQSSAAIDHAIAVRAGDIVDSVLAEEFKASS